MNLKEGGGKFICMDNESCKFLVAFGFISRICSVPYGFVNLFEELLLEIMMTTASISWIEV